MTQYITVCVTRHREFRPVNSEESLSACRIIFAKSLLQKDINRSEPIVCALLVHIAFQLHVHGSARVGARPPRPICFLTGDLVLVVDGVRVVVDDGDVGKDLTGFPSRSVFAAVLLGAPPVFVGLSVIEIPLPGVLEGRSKAVLLGAPPVSWVVEFPATLVFELRVVLEFPDVGVAFAVPFVDVCDVLDSVCGSENCEFCESLASLSSAG